MRQKSSRVTVRVRVEAILNPSEDPRKVSQALINVVGQQFSDRVRVGDYKVTLEAEGLDALSVMYRQVRSRRTMAVLRRLLRRNKSGSKSWVYLNRQAAYSGVIVFAESEEETPLGPILLEIESNDIDRLIEWLVPKEEALRA